MESNLTTLLCMQGRLDEALAAAKVSKKYASTRTDDISLHLSIARY